LTIVRSFVSVGRLTRVAAIGAAVPLLIALTGCGSSDPTAAATQPTTASQPVTVAPSALVGRVGLVDSDLRAGGHVRLYQAGDQVQGQVTLDNCGYDFTTEAYRVARRQVGVVNPKNRKAFFSNEVVAYDTPARAAMALNQFRMSVVHCPRHTFQKSTVASVPPLRYDVSRLRPTRGLPVSDSAVAAIVVNAKGGRHLYGLLIFQRQGTVLSGIYLQSSTRLAAADIRTEMSLAKVTGGRLAALSTATTGA
jgi:hypothetical protein